MLANLVDRQALGGWPLQDGAGAVVIRRALILSRNAITRGIWEAKDTEDNLRVEIAKKIDKII